MLFRSLNGTVEVRSQIGVGTTFTIRLPLTLAILPSLLARIGDVVYAMPLENVQEIVSVPNDQVFQVAGKDVVRVRGDVVSLAKLSDAFTWPGGYVPAARPDARERLVVILCDNDVKVGLEVDRLIGEEEIVIKSLAENYTNVKGLAGASILGDEIGRAHV